MKSQTFTVLNPSGFHARPTKIFVQTAGAFPCKVNVIKNGKKVNGKSSLSMLTLGIAQNDEVTLETDGEQEEQALKELGELLVKIYEE
ncbi:MULTISPECIES: HPr family phosphocarrier protein [Paenibacillus]|uniref:Phosphocarrier protein HPr n=1 Tax=Paenibacillus naphthalenovorans TaxID=162209 RepID=A0A0U2W6D2_9BACL|nr:MULTISPECIES: HPr family phosphocarrier protein [Paenibacillus]ALS24116.1 phosphocarrier protein HPr [Paenibacillus naphthalenovorans]NTZ19836.1 HPr family phosphocarrier protein [Paenibacillus sp. JMULE4]GCL72334.1 HPr family phosphocarrier protein [Paenibacillus naphthalenovorans]SDJ20388.1 phosphocarrier protein [Paenibacillus naphthalenovorans]